MIRKGFLMTLKPGHQEEYERRHNPIWPELKTVLQQHGVHNYSLFLERGSDKVFAYAELESEELWEQVAGTEICRRWWSYMKELMLTSVDESPVVVGLDEVFHLD